ncbi:hypothetical protein FRB91_007534 [Serendipita sp. 411]|nr:hypothetical protein FRC19_000469 [Serendipita sp. 401]KAG8838622.1 hypothetical protein FRB91_007534 [Serendipita sp. 411]
MRVEKTGTSRANEGVHHAECVICGRGTNTQKLLKVQHIAKHLTSDEWKLKPWRCMFCSTAYSYNDGSLKTHMKKVHNKEEYDTRGTADDGTNSTLLTPGIPTAVQVDHPKWRNSNEYLHPSPTHSVSTSYQSPPVATPDPSPYQHSNFQPGLDIVKSPPTGISSGGRPVTPTYITSLSLPPYKGKEPTVLPTQPPLLDVAPTFGNPFPTIAPITVGSTFVHQPYVDPSSRAGTALLPHQLGIRQAVALSAHAGRAIVTNPTTDSRSMRSGSFSGTHSHYQPPIQGAINANQIPIGNVVNPLYNAPPLMGYNVAPSNGGTNKPQPVYPGYTGQVVQVPGPSNIRPSQPVSGYAPAPTEPRRQGQPRPPLQIPPPTAATYSIARSSNTDPIGSSDPFMAKSGPISGTTSNTTNTSTRNTSQYPGQYGPTQQLMNQLLSPPHKDYRPSSSF